MKRGRLPRPERCSRGFLLTPHPPVCKEMEENVKAKGNDIGLAHVITVRLLCLLNQANTERR
jgi:hypothetical protein